MPSRTWVIDQIAQSGTVHVMYAFTLSTLTGGAGAWMWLGAALAVLTAPVINKARQRTLAQPLVAHPSAERRIIAGVVHTPGVYAYIHQLAPEHFTDKAAREIWQHIAARHSDITMPTGGKRTIESELSEAAETVPDDLGQHLSRISLSEGAAQLLEDISEDLADAQRHNTLDSRATLVEQAELVYNTGLDRVEYAGNARIEITDDPNAPLRRLIGPTTWLRRLTVMLMLSVGGLIAVRYAMNTDDTLEGWLVGAALTVLTVGSVIWALIDHDTMYVDLPTFWAFTSAAWALTVGASLFVGEPGRALTGLVVTLMVVTFIELTNQVFKRVRGQDGMGGGDYLFVLATIGVPVGLTGDWVLGQWILLTSLLSGIVGWVIIRLRRAGFTKASPYAFGPYLACGWLLTMFLWGIG